jgi:hypothetical protein
MWSLTVICQEVPTPVLAPDTTVNHPQTQVAPSPASNPAPAPEPERTKRDTRPWSQRIGFGLGSSFWVNTNQTYIEVAPYLAYKFPKRLITGVGYRYIYRHSRVGGEDLNAYGPSVFARYQLLKRIYLWSEYEHLNSEYETGYGQLTSVEKTGIDSWYAGIGYVRSFGKKGKNGISIQVLYNMLYNSEGNNPYYSPVIYRVGYFF